MAKRFSLVIVILTVLSLITPLATTHAEGSATIQAAPSAITVKAGATFTLNVTVSEVADLAVWEFGLFYLNTILNCTNIAEGPFLKEGGNTFFTSTIRNAYNTTHGWLLAGSTLLGQTPGENGSGTLATITFQAKSAGDTILQFSTDPQVTFLKDSSPPPRHLILFTTIDGSAHVTANHEVAVTSVTPCKTKIGQNYSGRINVTIVNEGDYSEIFSVTAYANTTNVNMIENITLAGGNTTVQIVVWNTTGFAYGNYNISACAQPVPGETNTQDNNRTSLITVTVTMAGDLALPSGVIDMKDVAFVAKRFGSDPSDQMWDSNADMDDSGKVDMKDIAIVAKNFGKRYP